MVHFNRQLVAVACAFALVLPIIITPTAFAQEAASTPAGSASVPNGFNMDLESTVASMAAPVQAATAIYQGGHMTSEGLLIGASQQMVAPGQMLTPAQYVALSQVMSTGAQTLVLSSTGAAAAGFVTLTPNVASTLSSMVIPSNVSINSIGYTATTPFNVVNNGTVNGALYALQQATSLTSVLNFGSLSVGPSGLISAYLPSYASALPGVVNSGALTLSVAGSLHNAGGITSPGALNINAMGAIYNQTMAATQASMAAATVNLYSATGNIVNTGIITATQGNLNIATALSNSLAVNNTGGTMRALMGAINIGNLSEIAKVNTTLTGGNWLSQALNVHSGDGKIAIDVQDLTGIANLYGGAAHIKATTENLMMGEMKMTGDPAIYNTNGDVTITSLLDYPGENLIIVASRNIKTGTVAGQTPGLSTRTTNPLYRDAGDLVLIAGADFTSSSGDSSSNEERSQTLTIFGPSATGGYIDLTQGTPVDRITSATIATGYSAGDIMLVAYLGSGPNLEPDGGKITTPSNVTMDAGATGTGANGNLTIIAGATSGNSIHIGNINLTGGTGGSGSTNGVLTIASANPAITSTSASCSPCVKLVEGSSPVFDGTGYQSAPSPYASDSGRFTSDSFQGGSITLGTIETSGNVFIAGGGDISSTSAGTINLTGGTGGTFNISDAGAITTGTNGSNLGGTVYLGGNTIGASSFATTTLGSIAVSSTGLGIGEVSISPPPNTVLFIAGSSGFSIGASSSSNDNTVMLNGSGASSNATGGDGVTLTSLSHSLFLNFGIGATATNPSIATAVEDNTASRSLMQQFAQTNTNTTTFALQGQSPTIIPTDVNPETQTPAFTSFNTPSVNWGLPTGQGQQVTPINAQVVGTDQSNLDLTQNPGSIISMNTDSTINLKEGTCNISKSAFAFACETGNDGLVMNFHCGKVRDVTITVGDRRIRVHPGQAALMTPNQTESFDKLNPYPQIGYRHVVEYKAPNGTRVFVCEFSIPSAILCIKQLKDMLHSNKPQDRKHIHQLLKTASILALINPGTPYKSLQ